VSTASALSPEPAAPVRLLVIEDVESDYELLLAELRRNGFSFTAHRVQSAAEMRAALAAAPWDLVISDYNLPGFDALGALDLLHDLGVEAPFLLMSGAIGEEAAVEAMRRGAVDYVPKDRPLRLPHAIRRSLEAAAERRERRRAEAALTAVAANLPGMLFRLRTSTAGSILSIAYVSSGVQQLFGLSPQEAMADATGVTARLHPEDRRRFLAELESAALARRVWRGEFRIVTDEGRTRWIQLGASPRVEEGVLTWDGLATDITPLKRAEARLTESQAQLRSLSGHLERAKESERATIAREIHDDIGGGLTAMRADLATLARHIEGDPVAKDCLARLEQLVASAQQSSQSIARALRPVALDQGLYTALAWQARDFEVRHGVACRVNANERELVLDEETSTALFRISQESLTNIAKHAAAHKVDVTLFSDATIVSLEIRDDGRGVDPADLDKTGSFGIFGMHERVRDLGGWLEVSGQPGAGTTLMVVIPRHRARRGAP
jgi:PAS domain S-box-containing protein